MPPSWLPLLLCRGAVSRRTFWLLWPIVAAPWIAMWLQPTWSPLLFVYGWCALLIGLYPTICLFVLRRHGAGSRGWWCAPVWLLLALVSGYATFQHMGYVILAVMFAWPGSRGLLDIGPMSAIVCLAAATLGFLALSLTVGLARPTQQENTPP